MLNDFEEEELSASEETEILWSMKGSTGAF